MELDYFDIYLNTIKGENTRKAALIICKKLLEYMNGAKIEDIRDFSPMTVDIFIKREYNNKSNTTIASFISRIKDMFKYYNNFEAVKHLNLQYVKSITKTNDIRYFSPGEIFDLIENLLNYQDKALVLLIYLGLYDEDMNLIRNLKKEDLGDHILHIKGGEDVKLNDYCYNILKEATVEEEAEKYIVGDVSLVVNTTYKLDMKSPYLIRARAKKVTDYKPLVSPVLKKRFSSFSRYFDEKITPISIKNSRIVYDLIMLEKETNGGFDINQLELKDALKFSGVKGTIEQINMIKKQVRLKTIRDVIAGKDWFIK